VHRDLYEEQVLLGERVALIDLDDAALGPPELDIGTCWPTSTCSGYGPAGRPRRRSKRYSPATAQPAASSMARFSSATGS
jgi:hypothetical protein